MPDNELGTAGEVRGQLPPGQQLVGAGKWPSVGESVPRADTSLWRVEVTGLVKQPMDLSLEALRALAQVEQLMDIHCVTRWSRLGVRFGGVALATLLAQAGVSAEARFVSFVARSERQHSTSLPIDDAL